MNLESALSHIREVPDFPQPGVLFRDITPLLSNAQAFTTVVDELLKLNPERSQFAGIEARGFILASAMAIRSSSGLFPLERAGNFLLQFIPKNMRSNMARLH